MQIQTEITNKRADSVKNSLTKIITRKVRKIVKHTWWLIRIPLNMKHRNKKKNFWKSNLQPPFVMNILNNVTYVAPKTKVFKALLYRFFLVMKIGNTEKSYFFDINRARDRILDPAGNTMETFDNRVNQKSSIHLNLLIEMIIYDSILLGKKTSGYCIVSVRFSCIFFCIVFVIKCN